MVIGLVDRGVKPEARETQIDARLGRRSISEREILRLIGDFRRLSVRYLVDIDPVLVEEAAMEELHFERQLFTAPERAVRQEPYGAVMVVIQIVQVIRQFAVRRLERFAGCIPSQLPNDRSVKWRRLCLSGR